MRLIHTSDWHLGQTLHGQDRDYEHAQFLAWLLDQLVDHRVDALLIAGDVFDTVNPPLRAQECLYDFIVRAHERLPQLDIVMIAGNHDSGGRIELPAPLMKRLNAHAVGRISWIEDGQLDHQRLLVPLHDAAGNTAESDPVAVCVDNTPPTVEIAAPAPNAAQRGLVAACTGSPGLMARSPRAARFSAKRA